MGAFEGLTMRLATLQERNSHLSKENRFVDDSSRSSSTRMPNPFRWVGAVGYYYDEEVGTYYVRARNYSATMARWLSQDPLFFPMVNDVISLLSFSQTSLDPDFFGALPALSILSADGSGRRQLTTRYSSGPNLYEYVKSAPLNWFDASGLDTFYVCGRKIQEGGGTGQDTARICACHHVDIYSDDLGQIRVGFGGGGGGGGDGVPRGPEFDCTELRRSNYSWDGFWPFITRNPKTATWGSAAGKNCDTLTDAEIADCIRSKPSPPGNPGVENNCQTDILGAQDGCCLTGYSSIVTRPIVIRPWDLFF